MKLLFERKTTKEDVARRKKFVVRRNNGCEVTALMSGDQRALTGVKGDFPTVFQEIERGRASYMQLSHNG